MIKSYWHKKSKIMKLTEEVFNQIVDDIESLYLDCERIIITGSVALCAYGIKEDFNDVDIIVVNPTKECHSDLLNYHRNEGYSLISVRDKTFVMDLFIDNCPQEHPIIEVSDGIYLSTLDCVIDAKRYLDRYKDKADFECMINRLTEICGMPFKKNVTKEAPCYNPKRDPFIISVFALCSIGLLLIIILKVLSNNNLI